MRSTAAADWRSGLPLERGVRLSEVVPGDDARCALCGTDAEPRPREQLWAYKHRHPQHHDGWVRIYCDVHVPQPAPAPTPAVSARPTRAAAPRRPAAPDVRRAVCPDCFVEVPATGVCGVCGATVAA